MSADRYEPPNENADWGEITARLAGALDAEHPPAWNVPPVDGAEIVGVVVEVQPSVHTAHGAVPVVTLEGPNGGRRSVWLAHQVLRNLFIRADVLLGEKVAIRYVGMVEPKGGGNRYADYRLVVDRDGGRADPDWKAIAAATAHAARDEPAAAPDVESAQNRDDIPF